MNPRNEEIQRKEWGFNMGKKDHVSAFLLSILTAVSSAEAAQAPSNKGQGCPKRVALTVLALLFAADLIHPRPLHAGLTSTVGAESSSKEIASCPQGMLMDSIHAVSDEKSLVLRKVGFRCKGIAPDGSTTSYQIALMPSRGSLNYMDKRLPQVSVTCPTGQVLNRIDLRGINGFIRGISTVQCRSASGTTTGLSVNVGGEGSAVLGHLACPSYEGIRQIELWPSPEIVGMRGDCAVIGVPPIPVQIERTLTPKPSSSIPVSIAPGTRKTFSFTITGASQAPEPFLIQAETPLDDGGSTNPPRFRIEALNPTGQIILTQEVSLQPGQNSTTFSLTLNVTGLWRIGISNLKSPTGKLEIKRLGSDRK